MEFPIGNYISPASRSYIKKYPSDHHYNLKGFWESPLALIQHDCSTYTVYLIPEVEKLIAKKYRGAESFHGETVALLVKQGVFSIKKIGELKIIQNQCNGIVIPCKIPSKYMEKAIKCILEAKSELGLNTIEVKRNIQELEA